MKVWTKLFFCFTVLLSFPIFSSCDLVLLEPIQLIAQLKLTYAGNSADDKLTLGDMDSNALITVTVPDNLEEATIPDTDWLLTIQHDDTVFAFEGALKFDSPAAKRQSIGPGSGNQLKSDGYAQTDWTANTLFGFTNPMTLTLRLEANGRSTTKNFPGIRPAALEIHTWRDLQAMQHRLSGTFTVMKDIYFPKPGSDGFPRQGFSPVGDRTKPFRGKLIGGNKTISKFFINQKGNSYLGLFGVLENATIKNLTIELVSLKGDSSVGVLAGSAKGSTISNVHVREGSITANTKTGGLIGICLETGCTIERASVLYITVTASSQVGGMIGHMEQGSIKNSYTLSSTVKNDAKSLSATVNQIGGMIGSLGKTGNDPDTVTLQNIYTANEVAPLTGASYVALFLGRSLFQATMQAPTAYYCGTTTTGNTIGVDPQLNRFSGAIFKINPEKLERRGGNYYADATTQVFTGWDFKNVWQWTKGSCPALR